MICSTIFVEFENLVPTKQMRGITIESEEEALYTSKSWSNNKPHGYKNRDKGRVHKGTAQLERAQKNNLKISQGKRFEGICYNCWKKGYMSKDCWFKK